MKEPENYPSLDALGKDIERLHDKVAARSKPRESSNNAALQVGLELVAGVMVGLGAGIMLDKWLHTSPLFLITCFLLGTAGGFLTIYRTANRTADKQEPDDNVTNSDEGKYSE